MNRLTPTYDYSLFSIPVAFGLAMTPHAWSNYRMNRAGGGHWSNIQYAFFLCSFRTLPLSLTDARIQKTTRNTRPTKNPPPRRSVGQMFARTSRVGQRSGNLSVIRRCRRTFPPFFQTPPLLTHPTSFFGLAPETLVDTCFVSKNSWVPKSPAFLRRRSMGWRCGSWV